MSNILKIKKIKSSYMDKEYELKTFEKENQGDIMTIISHNSLEDLMHNTLMNSDHEVKYDMNFIECTERHTVVECVVWDNKSRRISGIGESSSKSLESEIAKQYPSLIATQRAFDRAIIRYLGFEGKIYSDTEIFQNMTFEELPPTLEITEEDNASNINETPIEVSIEDEVENSAIPVDEPVEPINDTVIEENTENIDDNLEDMSKYDVIVNVGKYRGKNKTIPEIYKEDTQWFNWMITECKSKTAVETIKLMKEYLAKAENK